MHRRQLLSIAAGAAVLPFAARIARAQAYPARPVRIIVPFAPGGTNDILGRLIGQWLSERLGQSFVVENRPGAGTNIGTEAVVRAPADGHTLLLIGTPSAINATPASRSFLMTHLTVNMRTDTNAPSPDRALNALPKDSFP